MHIKYVYIPEMKYFRVLSSRFIKIHVLNKIDISIGIFFLCKYLYYLKTILYLNSEIFVPMYFVSYAFSTVRCMLSFTTLIVKVSTKKCNTILKRIRKNYM